MKKFIIGLIVGAILFIPMAAHAWSDNQRAKPLIGFRCDPSNNNNCDGVVEVFDDQDNKCYIARGRGDDTDVSTSISCVKATK